MHQAKLCVLGCAGALIAKDDGDIEIGSSEFDSSDVHPEQLGITGHDLQEIAVRHRSRCRIIRQGVVKTSAALPREFPTGAAPPNRGGLHDEDGT